MITMKVGLLLKREAAALAMFVLAELAVRTQHGSED